MPAEIGAICRERETQRQTKPETVRDREIDRTRDDRAGDDRARDDRDDGEREREEEREGGYLFYEYSHHFICLLQCSPFQFCTTASVALVSL